MGPKIYNPKMYSQRECFGAPFLELISALACMQESALDPPSRALSLADTSLRTLHPANTHPPSLSLSLSKLPAVAHGLQKLFLWGNKTGLPFFSPNGGV